MKLYELQVDRIVGPTHHFGGLGVGNIASYDNAGRISNPAAAATECLDKIAKVAEITGAQLLLPPQPRPAIDLLRGLGFSGTDDDVLRRAFDQQPMLLSAACSSSAMWMANAATVTPAIDSEHGGSSGKPSDARPRMTVANLTASVHRAIEAGETEKDFRALFSSCALLFPSLPGGNAIRDEGAANQMRIGTSQCEAGIHLFVYGDGCPLPTTRTPRHSEAASRSIARLHGLHRDNVFFLKQSPQAIDAGAFHNDVVAMSHQGLLIYHQEAFHEGDSILQNAAARFTELTQKELRFVEVPSKEFPLNDAIQTYLFNSQIVSSQTDPDAPPQILCPSQVQQHDKARQLVEGWRDEGLFSAIHYVELEQSMAGGGGPACLRLRVPVTEESRRLIPDHAFWNPETDQRLREAFNQFYPTEVTLEDLARRDFHLEIHRGWSAVRKILRR